MHEAVVLTAEYLIVASLIITALCWLKLSRKLKIDFLITIVISGIIALVLAYIGRKIYYDPRPFVSDGVTPYFSHAPDNGFPSDHTLLSSLLGFAVFPYYKRIGLLVLAFAALIGTARVVAGVHHLTDIIGAFAITFVSYYAVRYLYGKIKAKSSVSSKK